MAYNEYLAHRIREHFSQLPNVEEKEMMGGLTFMYNGKMCVGIVKDDLMCRIAPEAEEMALEKPGCRPMDFTKRPMKGYVFVDETGWDKQKDFEFWMELALDFNARAKASKKNKTK